MQAQGIPVLQMVQGAPRDATDACAGRCKLDLDQRPDTA